MENPQNIQGPGTSLKFLRVIQLGEIHTTLEAMIDKMLAYPTPKKVKQIQTFVGVWGTYICYLAQYLHPLNCLLKKGHIRDEGSD